MMAKKSARKKAYKKYVAFNGRILIIGFGSIGQGVLPLILRHIGIARSGSPSSPPRTRGSAEAEAITASSSSRSA